MEKFKKHIEKILDEIKKFSENELVEIKKIIYDEKFIINYDIDYYRLLNYDFDFNNLEKSIIDRYNILVLTYYHNRRSKYTNVEKPKLM